MCEDHDAPFKFIADIYFERLSVVIDGERVSVQGALAMANRGGSKTHNVAITHYLNATFKPGCGCLQFGATEQQGKRCYENIEDWCFEHDPATGRRTDKIHDFIDGVPMRSETDWKTGSKVEVVAGSEKAVSGPHPQKAGADEVDQMERGVWEQSRGMAVAKQATGPLPEFMQHLNGVIPPQDIVTSTRNSRHGLMQELIDEYDDDLKNGNIPSFQIFIWCIFETIAEVPNCRGADPEAREARLLELGRDPKELCACNRVVKGRNEEGEPRTLESVCRGKAFKSRGWKPYVDFAATFKRNTPGTWMLQHECRKGRDENNYIQDWDLQTYGIRNYRPDPRYGPIYQGIDWGGTNPHCVLWLQYLHTEVPAIDYNYNPIYLSPGQYVLFREIYVAGIDTPKLAERVKQIENGYRVEFGRRWKVSGRFMDPQGKGDRIYFARKGMAGSWPVITRDKSTMITAVQNVVMDDRFAVDFEACPMFCDEIEVWQKDPKNDKELDDFNHCVTGDTEVQTREGIFNAADLVGNTVDVLCIDGKYRPAEWKCYGRAPVFEIEFEDGETVRATDRHRWFVRKHNRGGIEEVTTLELEGRRVPFVSAQSCPIEDRDLYEEGVRNGLVYGDGTTFSYAYNGERKAVMRQYGDENCTLAERFFSCGRRRESEHLGVKVETSVLDPALKLMPEHTSRDYTKGFIAGLIAADGSVHASGSVYITTHKADDVDQIVHLCRSIGIVVNKIQTLEPGAQAYPNATTGYRIYLSKIAMDDELILKPSHRRYALDKRAKQIRSREVVRVTPLGHYEETFCCEEPETHSWVLGFGAVTGNSMAAWRYCIANAEIIEGKTPVKSNGMRRNGTKSERPQRFSPYLQDPDARANTRVKRVGPVTIVGGGTHPTDQFSMR